MAKGFKQLLARSIVWVVGVSVFLFVFVVCPWAGGLTYGTSFVLAYYGTFVGGPLIMAGFYWALENM